jgi:hypothetical protein
MSGSTASSLVHRVPGGRGDSTRGGWGRPLLDRPEDLPQESPLTPVETPLGHATVSITLDVYSHVLGTLQREAADKADEPLGG